MDTYEVLKRAIQERRQVVARYDGARRELAPHALGRKRGERHLLAYQFGGASARGEPVAGEWRCLRLDRLSEVALRPGEWHTAPNVFNPQSCVDEIEVVAQPLPSLAQAGDDDAG